MKKKELAERIAAIEKHLGIEPKQVELEVGKWYKTIPSKNDTDRRPLIAFFNGTELSSNYGFTFHGKWSEKLTLYHKNVGIDTFLATPEEVKSALVEEAKRRGYAPFYDYFYYDYSLGVLYDREGIGREVIFSNGKWAEIIEQPKSILDGKVAIQISNEREFEMLMKHYEEKGWNLISGFSPLSRRYDQASYDNNELFVEYHDGFTFRKESNAKHEGYTIIPFSEFAAEVGIEVPVFIMKSEDGVDLYEGDKYHYTYFCRSLQKWVCGESNREGFSEKSYCLIDKEKNRVFSTREAAEKWIEQQNKPKEIKLFADSVPVLVTKDSIYVDLNKSTSIRFSHSELTEIYSAIQQLKGGENGQN